MGGVAHSHGIKMRLHLTPWSQADFLMDVFCVAEDCYPLVN